MLPVYSDNTVNMHKAPTLLVLFLWLVLHLNFVRSSVFIRAGLCLTSCLSAGRILEKQLGLLDYSFLWDYLMGFFQVTPWRGLKVRAVTLFIGFFSFSQDPELHNVMWSHCSQSYSMFVPYLPMLGSGHQCSPETSRIACALLCCLFITYLVVQVIPDE